MRVAWLKVVDDQIPENAVKASDDEDCIMYVARADIFGDRLPGKYVIGDGCYVAYDGEEHKAPDYEVLVISTSLTFGWEASSLGVIPRMALEAGYSCSKQQPYFIGRGVYNSNTICGKIARSDGCLLIGYGGKEHSILEYEVLVLRKPVKGIKWITPEAGQIPDDAVVASSVGDTLLYVARGVMFDAVLPGKFIPGDGCYVSGDKALGYKEEKYQILTIEADVTYEWLPSCGFRNVPKEAIVAGYSCDGESLYIGRGVVDGQVLCGKIQLGHGCLYLNVDGFTRPSTIYEVFAIKSPAAGIIWVSCTDCEEPENAVRGGTEGNLSLYVARAAMFGDVLPGKLVEGDGCYVTYDGLEYKASNYQVLTISNNVMCDWNRHSLGTVSHYAICGGITKYGEQLYIGRGVWRTLSICGKIHRSKHRLFIGHNGEEYGLHQYEVLVACPSIKGVDWVTGQLDEVPENAVKVGFDGVDIVYVARAEMFGGVIPGKFIPGEGGYVSYAGKEYKAPEYEVLTISSKVRYDWEVSFSGFDPRHTFIGGITADRQPLFIGRGFCKEATISGKVQKGQDGLFVGYEGKEVFITEYEVLVFPNLLYRR